MSLMFLLLFASALSACMGTRHVEMATNPKPDHMVGLTTRAGQDVPFSAEGATIVHDTLYAIGKHGQVIVPVDSIQRIWVRQFSTGRTIVLGVSIVAALGIALTIALESSPVSYFPP